MATQWQTFPIEFRGGLISNMSPLQQGTNAVGSATILQNFTPNKEGGYSRINGYEKYSASVIPGSGPVLAAHIISAGRMVVARKNLSNYTEWYYGTGSSWNSMAVSPTTGGSKARWVTFDISGEAKTIFVDGVNFPGVYSPDAPNTFNFMSAANSPEIVGSSYVAVFKSTTFYAKGTVLYFTAPFSMDDFSPANGAGTINVLDDITGLAVFRDQLVVFTKTSVKRITGSSAADFLVSPITDRIGCISGDSIQEVGGDIMYLAPDGLRLLSATDRIGDFGLDIASDSIFKDANTFVASSQNFCSVVFREKAQYRIFSYIESESHITSKGLSTTKFQSQGGSGFSWSTIKGIKAFVADSKISGNSEVSVFANEDGYLYKLDTGNSFDGNSIEAIYESPFMSINDPQVRKTFYKVVLYVDPRGAMDIKLNLKYDFASKTDTSIVQPDTVQVIGNSGAVVIFGATNAVFGSSNFGGEIDRVYSSNVVGSGKTISLRIEDNSTNPSFSLDTAVIEYRTNDRQ